MKLVHTVTGLVTKRAAILAVLIVVAVGAAVPVTPVSADDSTPPPPSGQRAGQQLEACLDRLGEWHSAQEQNLGRAADATQRIEDMIEKAQSLGIDTSEAEALLAQAVSLLAAADGHHDDASAILEAHKGSDGNGEVIDREQAGDTCRTGRDALANGRDSLQDLRGIGRDLRALARMWRQTYRQAPTPEAG
ncbi:MAG: hypothetical protein MUO23_06735 [Anaerolineales bacterium]|nr:hypothetical protein [Anaerolineales bacterium]